MFRPQAKVKTRVDQVDNILEYINTIKPYHTKIVDTVVKYSFVENINTSVIETNDTTLDLWFDERSFDKQGFEKHGFGIAGIDQFPDQEDPSPTRYENESIYDRILGGTNPTSNVYFCGLDDVTLDGAKLDLRVNDTVDLHEGLDDTALDYNTYDSVFVDKQAIELYNKNVESKLRDFHLNSEYFDDHLEDPSSTTIKSTITENVIIDISRQFPLGFDKSLFDTDDFDTLPREVVVITNPGAANQTITLVTTTPASKSFSENTVNDSEK
jgi:hypothetical protein